MRFPFQFPPIDDDHGSEEEARCKTRRVLLALRLFQDVLEKVAADDGRAYLQFRSRINFIARVYKSYRKGEEEPVEATSRDIQLARR